MTNEEIEYWAKNICFADWHYEKSDDYGVWQRGRNQIENLIKEAREQSWSDEDYEMISSKIAEKTREHSATEAFDRVFDYRIARLQRLRKLNNSITA